MKGDHADHRDILTEEEVVAMMRLDDIRAVERALAAIQPSGEGANAWMAASSLPRSFGMVTTGPPWNSLREVALNVVSSTAAFGAELVDVGTVGSTTRASCLIEVQAAEAAITNARTTEPPRRMLQSSCSRRT